MKRRGRTLRVALLVVAAAGTLCLVAFHGCAGALWPLFSKRLVKDVRMTLIKAPQWAFDGSSIIFERHVLDQKTYLVSGGAPIIGGGAGYDSDRAIETREIMRLDIARKDLTPLAEGFAHRVSGSMPLVVYLATPGADLSSPARQLWIHDWRSGQRHEIARNVGSFQMSPAGSSLLFEDDLGLQFATATLPPRLFAVSTALRSHQKSPKEEVFTMWAKTGQLYVGLDEPGGARRRWFRVRGEGPKVDLVAVDKAPSESELLVGFATPSPAVGIPSPDGRLKLKVAKAKKTTVTGAVKMGRGEIPVELETEFDSLVLLNPDGTETPLIDFQPIGH